jgi:hypothetical protein
MGYAVSIDKSYFFMYKYGMINRITTVHVDQVSKLISPLSAPRDRPTKVGFLRGQLRSPMPKRLHPARVSAAVAAGDPPASAQYAYDDAWHDAQNIIHIFMCPASHIMHQARVMTSATACW